VHVPHYRPSTAELCAFDHVFSILPNPFMQESRQRSDKQHPSLHNFIEVDERDELRKAKTVHKATQETR